MATFVVAVLAFYCGAGFMCSLSVAQEDARADSIELFLAFLFWPMVPISILLSVRSGDPWRNRP